MITWDLHQNRKIKLKYMPLKKASCGTKKCVNKAVSTNMHELKHFGTKQRSHKQMVAIAISAAKKSKR